MTKLCWQSKTTPPELHAMLKTLGERYPIASGRGPGLRLAFEKAAEPGFCAVEQDGSVATIRYGSTAQAGRALGALLGGLAAPGSPYRESTPFTMFGVMLDCSRNAVMTVEHLKLWMQRLALLGYNMVMLYTEDTYEIPGEPYFGYQRGAYTERELRAIDAYAARLGIEIIPCIQTLGHMGQILRHDAYAELRESRDVLLVGEPKTYVLIEKMIARWRAVCRTRRIHIGMDEAHDLGRVRHLDLHGYRPAFDLFNEHLDRVVGICGAHDFRPMIWSDMYFRLGSRRNDYYDPAAAIPQDVVSKIPGGVELVYWDYYHDNKAFYLDWIARHRALGKEPVMGSGIWTWNRYWYDHRTTLRTATHCIDACREVGVKEIFFTEWGDNGAYCDHDSAFAGMAYCADRAYGAAEPSPERLEQRFAAVCGGSYAAHLLASEIHGGVDGLYPNLWDDPFFETEFRTAAADNPRTMAKRAAAFADLAARLRGSRADRATGDLLHAGRTAQAFADRYGLAAELLAAYRRKDRQALRRVRQRIPAVVRSLAAMEESFRAMWLSHNKPQGIETIQGRFGTLKARYAEMARRLDEYAAGVVGTIPEMDCRCPPR